MTPEEEAEELARDAEQEVARTTAAAVVHEERDEIALEGTNFDFSRRRHRGRSIFGESSSSNSPPPPNRRESRRLLEEFLNQNQEEEDKSDDDDDDGGIVFMGMTTNAPEIQYQGQAVGAGGGAGGLFARQAVVQQQPRLMEFPPGLDAYREEDQLNGSDAGGDEDGDSDIVPISAAAFSMAREGSGSGNGVPRRRAGFSRGNSMNSLFGTGSSVHGGDDEEQATMGNADGNGSNNIQGYQPPSPPSTHSSQPQAQTTTAPHPLIPTTSTESIIPLSSPPASPQPHPHNNKRKLDPTSPVNKKRKLDKGKGRATEEDLKRIEREEMEEEVVEKKTAAGGGFEDGDLLSDYRESQLCDE